MMQRKKPYSAKHVRKKHWTVRHKLLVVLACCGALFVVGAVVSALFHSLDDSPQIALPAPSSNTATDQNKAKTEPVRYEPASISLVAVGDNLIHNTLLRDASNGDGSYDFTPFYEDIKPYVEAADIAVVNQESPLGTGEPAAYPCFNTPQACGDALVSAGFDVISHANNHAMDSGSDAMYDTLDFWDTYADSGILRVGIARDAADRAKVRYLEKNGMKIGFLAYTYGLNGNPLPDKNPDLVSLIDREKIAEEMAAVKEQCDAVVVLMHWGEEYQTEENSDQNELAEFLAENGATLIIGGHPHVCQPCEWVEADNGNRAFCIYSTGNFISAQNQTNTMVEAMLQVTLTRQENGTVVVENPGVMPMVCYFNSRWRGYRAIPLDDYTEDMAESHALAGRCQMSPSHLRSVAEEIFGDYLISKTIPTAYIEMSEPSAA